MRRLRRHVLANARYLWVLLARFRVTFVLAAAVFGLAPLVYVVLYADPQGHRVSYGEAFHHVYFLMFGQPSLAYVDDWVIEATNLLIPPLGIAVIADGLVRFGLLAIARQRHDKEWVAIMSTQFTDHVVVCGAGRVGWRVATELRALGAELIVVEKNEGAAFVGPLRDAGIPVLIDDIKVRGCLPRTNIAKASALVAVTDDDLANINVALDARRHNAALRVVIRLFDDDLVQTVRESLGAQALSTSAVAAPHIALAALDPRIQHSFRIGPHLMVVGEITVNRRLSLEHVRDLRDTHGALTVAMRQGDEEMLHPAGALPLPLGAVLTVHARWEDWQKLREVAAGE